MTPCPKKKKRAQRESNKSGAQTFETTEDVNHSHTNRNNEQTAVSSVETRGDLHKRNNNKANSGLES